MGPTARPLAVTWARAAVVREERVGVTARLVAALPRTATMRPAEAPQAARAVPAAAEPQKQTVQLVRVVEQVRTLAPAGALEELRVVVVRLHWPGQVAWAVERESTLAPAPALVLRAATMRSVEAPLAAQLALEALRVLADRPRQAGQADSRQPALIFGGFLAKARTATMAARLPRPSPLSTRLSLPWWPGTPCILMTAFTPIR